jgi:hypothetical protein
MTFAQRRNRLTTHFSECIPVVKRSISVQRHLYGLYVAYQLCLYGKYAPTPCWLGQWHFAVCEDVRETLLNIPGCWDLTPCSWASVSLQFEGFCCFQYQEFAFLSTFAKLRKRLLASSCLSVRLSAWSNSAPNERIFTKFYILVFFENILRKFKFQ